MGRWRGTGRGSWRPRRRGVREPPCRGRGPPSPGSRGSPAAGPVPEAAAAGNKGAARPRDPESGATARGERQAGHESGFVAVRAGGRGAGAARDLAAHGGAAGGSAPRPLRPESGVPTYPAAPGLQLADRRPARLPIAGFPAGLRGRTRSLPGVSCSAVSSSRGSQTGLVFNKKFYKSPFLDIFAEFDVLSTSSHPLSCSWSRLTQP